MQLYDERIAGITSTSARTLQQAKPLIDFPSSTAKRNEISQRFGKHWIAIFRVNEYAGFGVGVPYVEVLAGSL
jgi:hypothetical protein